MKEEGKLPEDSSETFDDVNGLSPGSTFVFLQGKFPSYRLMFDYLLNLSIDLWISSTGLLRLTWELLPFAREIIVTELNLKASSCEALVKTFQHIHSLCNGSIINVSIKINRQKNKSLITTHQTWLYLNTPKLWIHALNASGAK